VIRRHECLGCRKRWTLKGPPPAQAPQEADGGPRSLSAAEAARPRKRAPAPNVRPAGPETKATDRVGGMPVGPISEIEGIKINVDFL